MNANHEIKFEWCYNREEIVSRCDQRSNSWRNMHDEPEMAISRNSTLEITEIDENVPRPLRNGQTSIEILFCWSWVQEQGISFHCRTYNCSTLDSDAMRLFYVCMQRYLSLFDASSRCQYRLSVILRYSPQIVNEVKSNRIVWRL